MPGAWTALRGNTAHPRRAGRLAGNSIIILTTFDLDHYVYAALTAGAGGFLLRARDAGVPGDRGTAGPLRRRAPRAFHHPPAGGAFRAEQGHHPPVHANLDALTPRELEVLRLLAHGLSNAELASQLTLSEATVKTHVGRILTKLQLRDRVQAVVVAYRTSLVEPRQSQLTNTDWSAEKGVSFRTNSITGGSLGHDEVDRPGQRADQCSPAGRRRSPRERTAGTPGPKCSPGCCRPSSLRRTGRWRTRILQLLRPRRALRTRAEPCAAARAAFVATVHPASRDNYDRCSAMRPELSYSGACTSSPGRWCPPLATSLQPIILITSPLTSPPPYTHCSAQHTPRSLPIQLFTSTRRGRRRRCRSSCTGPCRGRTSAGRRAPTASRSTSSRGTYHRGAKPDSYRTSGRWLLAISVPPLWTVSSREVCRTSIR